MLANLRAKLKGLRTYCVAALLGVPSLLASLGYIDLSPIVGLFVKDPQTAYRIMMAATTVFSLLRAVSNTSPGGMMSVTQSAPVRKNVDEGA